MAMLLRSVALLSMEEHGWPISGNRTSLFYAWRYDSPLLKEEVNRSFVTWCYCSLVLGNEYYLTVDSEEELFGAPLEDLEVEPGASTGLASDGEYCELYP